VPTCTTRRAHVHRRRVTSSRGSCAFGSSTPLYPPVVSTRSPPGSTISTCAARCRTARVARMWLRELHPADAGIALNGRGRAALRDIRWKLNVTSDLVTYSGTCVRRSSHRHSWKVEYSIASSRGVADHKRRARARIGKDKSRSPNPYGQKRSTSDVARVMTVHHVGSLPSANSGHDCQTA